MKLLTKIVAGIFTFLIVVVIALPTLLHNLGLHPEYKGKTYSATGKRALVITTSHATLNVPGETSGDRTGVAASELTHPYYTFLNAGMQVDVASIKGGEIPVDPVTLKFMIKSPEDDLFLKDPILQSKVKNSLRIDDIDFTQYDTVFMAGGWGAAYDMGYSEVLGQKISEAYYGDQKTIVGSVCHGALGLINATDEQGNPIIRGRAITGVTDKQIEELGIEVTPMHPETELRKAGVKFESQTAFRDFLATHVSIDKEQRFVTGQNQNSGLEAAHKIVEILAKR
ncbi:type 1 glutamine amidotransferase domain-containing protein [Pseudomaricurvus alkylphenolicus]|uniref:type 1 glutamine amidotransferase domain-containing protein n=1 Tax=Pseudomaricurvus alkylphenolicus TaxID=1306991 RepID=UPI001423863A|nr:type 1 glutamine amidotransferase domain-containing protein [Pseudomaricurvus alkylphenolicus]NIB43692.1 type 1 glutamine amidotransferase domain-containing protein [Pseudomaricurvus alkylphenolicus]